MIVLDLSILNQKGTPMFNSDIFANRPAFGIVGRIFISTDTKEFFRDTGTSWELIGGPGSGTITGSGTIRTLPIWTTTSALGDSNLTQFTTGALSINNPTGLFPSGVFTNDSGRVLLYNSLNDPKFICWGGALFNTGNASGSIALGNVTNLGPTTFGGGEIIGSIENGVDGKGSLKFAVTDATAVANVAMIIDSSKNSTFNGYISAVPTLTAASNASSVAIVGINTLSYGASFSANNIGSIYGGITGFNLQTFAGNATFANSNVASGGSSVNSIDFSSGGSTITMTQSSGIRVMSGQQNLFQYQGTNSGTITHAAISQNTGFYRPTAATGILTITNAYSHLINALDDYGAGFTFTNRWGIYQAGASDVNYFAASVLIGTLTNTGEKLIVGSTARIIGNLKAIGGILVNDVFNIFSITTNAGVVLQGYTGGLRIAVNGSGETGGARADLLAGSVDFSGTLDVSGVISIGNSVAAAVAAPSTHKVSILIGGVQYYLLASNV